jgi:hypothetical protein
MKKTVVGRHYQHVNNGGLTMSVIAEQHEGGEYAGSVIEVSDGYFGYSTHTLTFHMADPETLRKIGQMFLIAASKIEGLGAK